MLKYDGEERTAALSWRAVEGHWLGMESDDTPGRRALLEMLLLHCMVLAFRKWRLVFTGLERLKKCPCIQ